MCVCVCGGGGGTCLQCMINRVWHLSAIVRAHSRVPNIFTTEGRVNEVLLNNDKQDRHMIIHLPVYLICTIMLDCVFSVLVHKPYFVISGRWCLLHTALRNTAAHMTTWPSVSRRKKSTHLLTIMVISWCWVNFIYLYPLSNALLMYLC